MANIVRLLVAAFVGVAFPIFLRYFIRRCRSSYTSRLIPGSIAVITGASSGIGFEFARLFSQSKCHLVLVGRDADALREAQALCVSLGAPSVQLVVADLSTVEGTDMVGRLLSERQEKFKYLVLSAGIGAILPFSSDPSFYATCEKVMQINYFANVRLLQLLLPLLEKTNSLAEPSRVIVISSLAGMLPSVFRSTYTASKHAIQGFINALRGETEVALTLCCPSYVDTEFHKRAQVNGDFASGNQRRGMPPDVCAQRCLEGALRGDYEVLTTLHGKLGYVLRPLLTRFIDAQAKKTSIRSLQM